MSCIGKYAEYIGTGSSSAQAIESIAPMVPNMLVEGLAFGAIAGAVVAGIFIAKDTIRNIRNGFHSRMMKFIRDETTNMDEIAALEDMQL